LPFFKSLIVDLWNFQFLLLLQFFSSPLAVNVQFCWYHDAPLQENPIADREGGARKKIEKETHTFSIWENCKRKII
jgi:hypothetical protein